MAKGYVIPKEEFLILGVDEDEDIVIRNPASGFERIEVPLGDYEDFRVRVGLVRSPDYGKFEDYKIVSSESAFQLVQSLDFEPQETLGVLLLDSQNRVLGYHEVARGGLTQSAVEPKLLFQAAILADAVSLILVHNHPSGYPEPSTADIALTREVEKAANLLGFRLLDHLVVGADDYTSLADRGLI